MFVPHTVLCEIADDMQSSFENGQLHSQSRHSVIVHEAMEHLADRNLPTRISLARAIASIALATWQETILQTKQAS